jgi:hypothetical protein
MAVLLHAVRYAGGRGLAGCVVGILRASPGVSITACWWPVDLVDGFMPYILLHAVWYAGGRGLAGCVVGMLRASPSVSNTAWPGLRTHMRLMCLPTLPPCGRRRRLSARCLRTARCDNRSVVGSQWAASPIPTAFTEKVIAGCGGVAGRRVVTTIWLLSPEWLSGACAQGGIGFRLPGRSAGQTIQRGGACAKLVECFLKFNGALIRVSIGSLKLNRALIEGHLKFNLNVSPWVLFNSIRGR